MKKGFTLIELLAVIVILAIIALIATPIVLSIISDSKESTQLSSANMYLEAVDKSIAKEKMNDTLFAPTICEIQEKGNLICERDTEKEKNIIVEVKGDTPNSGTIILENGKIKDIELKYKEGKIIIYDETKQLIFKTNIPYEESENIEIPNLYNNTLTPVIYDGNNWKVADVTKKWYSYKDQEWANAVILNSSVDKDVGDVVTVDGENPDALAMLVWIPRYEYKIEGTYGTHLDGTPGTKELPGEIEVNFIKTNKKVPTTNYILHPAFNFGGVDISGIWVGKFELSYSDSTKSTTLMNCTDESCNEGNNLRILPNVQSLRKNAISSFFYSIRSMIKDDNIFGIDKSITDTHMIKNSEWGAVAYLAQSKYGKYGNVDYQLKEKEVYINNSSDYYTGRSGGSYGGNTAVNTVYEDQYDVTTQYSATGFYTYDGYLLEYNSNNITNKRNINKIASTTGNIYGIYDMSGGAWEYTIGVFANSDGEKWSGNVGGKSGFKGKIKDEGTDIEGLEWPNEKYYEVYKASSDTTITPETACNGGICYGYSLSETAGWYNDYMYFVSSNYPWLFRGGINYDKFKSGIFNYYYGYGSAYNQGTTRVVFTQST